MSPVEPTRSRNPSDSILMTLARAMFDAESGPEPKSWPHLDLDDPVQREFGDYELLQELGRGGMGVVYRARQRSLDRDVAIKFIAAGMADTFNVTRFLAEARAAARLMHPNIVPVHEVGSIDGVHYFSMPLVKGRTLASLLETGPMPVAQAIRLMLKLCDAIDYAHRLGLLHLDLKPANVLIDERGEPLVADFGLARHMDERGGVDAQEVSGTPSFMAPEQILIKQYRLTSATDIYALGALLYRCVAGVSPHGEGSPDELIQCAVAGRVQPLQDVVPEAPADLVAVTGKCLQLMPRDRYTGVAALADDLRRLRDGLPVSVRTPGRIERLRRWYAREPRLVGAIAALLVAILLGTAGSVAGWRVAAEREQAAIADRRVAEQARRDAEAQRVRAQIASELGARLFSFEGEADDRAADLIRWLGQRLPGDEAAQAEVLTAFAESVSATGRATADNLMFEIIAVAGAEYRKQAKAALLAGESPDRFLHAAMLSWADIESEGGADEFHRLLGQAMQARPDDPRVWLVAAKNCPLGRCRYPEAAQRLIALDGDNMHAFIIAASLQDFGPEWDRLLHEAALREHNDDYLGREYQMFRDAIRTANVPPPPLLRRPLELLALDDDPTSVISFYEAGRSVTLASYSRLVLGCGVSPGSPRAAPDLRADCLAVGTRMMRTPGGLISRMIGVALVRNLADDQVLAQEALETRRLYSFLSEQLKIRGPIAQLQYPSSQYFEDLATRGEMVAMQRQVAHLGGQVEPPADWRPESSVSLLSARERFDLLRATDADARRLLELKQYDQVLDQIVAFEARIGGRAIEPWLNARIWVTQARAEQALGKFEAAETTLKRAWGVVADFPPYTAEYGEALRAHVQLYQAWNSAAPGRGHDALLREWQQRLIRHDQLSTGR